MQNCPYLGDLVSLGLVVVVGISDDAHVKTGTCDVGQGDGPRETLVLVGVVVLQVNVKLDRLQERALLLLRSVEDGSDSLLQHLGLDLGHFVLLVESWCEDVMLC